MQPAGPIDTLELYSRLGDELVALLRGLEPEDWSRPTACALWTVKDIAAHLLDTDIRRLSFQRDGLPLLEPDTPITGYRDLVGFLDQLNADWVRAARRFSPQLLIELLAFIGPKICDLFRSLDPEDPALFAVAWAGEDSSRNWFDVARETTEKWLHQQQIREAVGQPSLSSREWLHPVLDTFLRALPHLYRDTPAEDGASIGVTVEGEAGGTWSLRREGGVWRLFYGDQPPNAESSLAHTTLDAETAWRLFTNSIDLDQARKKLRIEGDEAVGSQLCGLTAVMV
ncbi:MAG: maleylpyruvate isomerase family mycothiol-dependent enzyme [Acidobacteriota bacterium]